MFLQLEFFSYIKSKKAFLYVFYCNKSIVERFLVFVLIRLFALNFFFNQGKILIIDKAY